MISVALKVPPSADAKMKMQDHRLLARMNNYIQLYLFIM